jgi:hypothetical protein
LSDAASRRSRCARSLLAQRYTHGPAAESAKHGAKGRIKMGFFAKPFGPPKVRADSRLSSSRNHTVSDTHVVSCCYGQHTSLFCYFSGLLFKRVYAIRQAAQSLVVAAQLHCAVRNACAVTNDILTLLRAGLSSYVWAHIWWAFAPAYNTPMLPFRSSAGL